MWYCELDFSIHVATGKRRFTEKYRFVLEGNFSTHCLPIVPIAIRDWYDRAGTEPQGNGGLQKGFCKSGGVVQFFPENSYCPYSQLPNFDKCYYLTEN